MATLVPIPLLVLQICLISLSQRLLQRFPSLAPIRYLAWAAAGLSALVGLVVVSGPGADKEYWPALYAIAVLVPPLIARLSTRGKHGVYTLFFAPQLVVLGWYATYAHFVGVFLFFLEPVCLTVLTVHAVARMRHLGPARPVWPSLAGLAASLSVLLWLTAGGAVGVGLSSPWEFDFMPWSTVLPDQFLLEFAGLNDPSQYRLWSSWLALHVVWAALVLVGLAAARLGWFGLPVNAPA